MVEIIDEYKKYLRREFISEKTDKPLREVSIKNYVRFVDDFLEWLDTEENKTFSIFPPITERHTEEEKGWIAREKARSQRETLDSVLGDLSAEQKKLLNLID